MLGVLISWMEEFWVCCFVQCYSAFVFLPVVSIFLIRFDNAGPNEGL